MDPSNPYTTPQTENPVSNDGPVFEDLSGEELTSELIELQRCHDAQEVDELTALLKEEGIPHRVGSNSGNFDLSSIGSGNDALVIVSIRAQDYDAARAAMEAESLKSELPEDHYLWTSTDDELVEIVGHASEWSAYDVAHAKRLLQEREVDVSKIEENQRAYLEKLQKGKPASTLLVSVGWAFSTLGWIAVMYVGLGLIVGLMGIGIAWSLCLMKEKTPEGVFYTYDARSRKIGSNMMFVGCLLAVVALSYYIFYPVSLE